MINSHKIVFLFSGQGSQYRGMGEKLYQTYPCFAKSLHQSNAIVQQHLGYSLIEELYQTKEPNFDDLLLTHPAIVAIELAMLDLMADLGIVPDYVSGNSLGEFAAAVAAGIWTKEQALEAVIEQAKSILQSGIEGGMLTVMNESKSTLALLIAQHKLYIASENFPKHFTLSGKVEHLNEFQKELKRLDILFLRLPIRYPFHSPLIEVGKNNFIYYMYTAMPFKHSSKRFISGLYCKEIKQLPRDYFWNIASQTTNFTNFVKYMEAKGPCLYLDLGPSGTSATFVKYNLPHTSNSITHSIMSPYKMEEIQLKSLHQLLKRMA